MKRRDFIRTSAAAGVTGLVGAGCSSVKKTASNTGPGFDLHPFIREHPEAVFIKLTSIESKHDEQGIHDTAYDLARELIVKTEAGGYPLSTKITCKPNWTCNAPTNGEALIENRGVNTDKFFVEGFLKSVRDTGPPEVFIHECACPEQWEVHGWVEMARRNNFYFRDLTSRDFWDLKKGRDYTFIEVPDGIVFKEIAFQTPINNPDTFLINIAKFKAHGMGLSTSVKNLQGISCRRFHQFCGGSSSIFKSYDKRYHKYFHRNYLERVGELQRKHINDGIPRFDKPNGANGFYMEQWCQRMCDSFSVTPTHLNMVEGIYGRDGNGFQSGPHDGKAMDFMSNNIIFGVDAFRVDIISHWLGGHEPGNFGLFHIGIERGLSDVLDPFDIPVYLWDEGQAILTRLEHFTRTPLPTYYLQKNYTGDQYEPFYHLCDEPFDYAAWKSTGKTALSRPSVRHIGNDAHNRQIMEVSLPDKNDVYVNVLNRHGEIVWRLKADGLEPGVHEVVWDGFNSPGLYNVYVKGMGWDAKREMVIYS